MPEHKQLPVVGDGWIYRKIFVIPLVLLALVAIAGPAKGLMGKRFNWRSKK